MILQSLFTAILAWISVSAPATTVLVVDEGSGKPLSNLRVELVGERGRVVAQTTTDMQGRSTLHVRDGGYCVRAATNGYVDPLNSPAGIEELAAKL